MSRFRFDRAAMQRRRCCGFRTQPTDRDRHLRYVVGLRFAFVSFDNLSMRFDRQAALRATCAIFVFIYAVAILSAYSFNAFL